MKLSNGLKMKKFEFTCTCGDKMTMDAATREEAIMKFKDMMKGDMGTKHFTEKHPGQPVPSEEEMSQMLEANVQEVMEQPAM